MSAAQNQYSIGLDKTPANYVPLTPLSFLARSAAVYPDPAEASSARLQDWRMWLDNRLIDVVCPMAYTPDATVFATQIASVRERFVREAKSVFIVPVDFPDAAKLPDDADWLVLLDGDDHRAQHHSMPGTRTLLRWSSDDPGSCRPEGVARHGPHGHAQGL